MKSRPTVVPHKRVRRRKTDIMLAAAELAVLENGYAAMSMDAIAHRSAVSKRTVYDNFTVKEDLFAQVIERRCASAVPDFIGEDTMIGREPEEVLVELASSFPGKNHAVPQVQLDQIVVASLQSAVRHLGQSHCKARAIADSFILRGALRR